MGYLKKLVGKLGKKADIIVVGTGVILVNKKDEILVIQRADNKEWTIPGGSLELHESLEECAVREIREEVNCLVDKEDLNLNSAKAILEPVEKDGYILNVVSVTYWTKRFDSSDLSINKRESIGYKWMKPDDVLKLENITSYCRTSLIEYCNKIH